MRQVKLESRVRVSDLWNSCTFFLSLLFFGKSVTMIKHEVIDATVKFLQKLQKTCIVPNEEKLAI